MNWKDPEEVKEYNKNYYQKNREKCIALSKRWSQEHKEKRKLIYQKWKETHIKQYHKSTYLANKKYKETHPCNVIYWNVKTRCENPKADNFKRYGGKGIKCLLTVEDIEHLWDRDNAKLMIQPSIHRQEENDHYRLGNCEIMEWEEHKELHYERRRGYVK